MLRLLKTPTRHWNSQKVREIQYPSSSSLLILQDSIPPAWQVSYPSQPSLSENHSRHSHVTQMNGAEILILYSGQRTLLLANLSLIVALISVTRLSMMSSGSTMAEIQRVFASRSETTVWATWHLRTFIQSVILFLRFLHNLLSSNRESTILKISLY